MSVAPNESTFTVVGADGHAMSVKIPFYWKKHNPREFAIFIGEYCHAVTLGLNKHLYELVHGDVLRDVGLNKTTLGVALGQGSLNLEVLRARNSSSIFGQGSNPHNTRSCGGMGDMLSQNTSTSSTSTSQQGTQSSNVGSAPQSTPRNPAEWSHCPVTVNLCDRGFPDNDTVV